MAVEVHEDDAGNRFVVTVDGEEAGFAEYRDSPGQRAFTHTVVDDRFEGQGLGSKLIGAALDQARSAEVQVVPYCPFVRSYIERHDEYLDLVPADRRAEFELPAA